MFYEPKIRWNFEVLLYFSKTTKVDMSYSTDVLRTKKFDGTLKFCCTFRNRQKLIMSTIIDKVLSNFLKLTKLISVIRNVMNGIPQGPVLD